MVSTYVLTIRKGSEQAEMIALPNAQAVLQYVSQVGQNSGDPRQIDSIFELSFEGRVRKHQVVFMGKLMLRPVAEVHHESTN